MLFFGDSWGKVYLVESDTAIPTWVERSSSDGQGQQITGETFDLEDTASWVKPSKFENGNDVEV
jgi:hypothetical protein